MVNHILEQKVYLINKIKLINIFNILKESGDLAGCIDSFFNHVNIMFHKNIVKSGVKISDFLGDLNMVSWSYQDASELYELLLELH